MDERTAELLVERLIRRVEQANTYFLTKIGSSIKQIKKLTPTQTQQLIQILKYGGNLDEIIKQIAKYTGLNVADISDIFSAYAKQDRMFYEQFYKYRGIPFEESGALQLQREALTRIAMNEMYNFTRDNVLGYTINGKFYNLRDTYNKLLDDALLNVGQGKETFDSAVRKTLQQIGGSGLRTVEYESGRSVRLDSAIRMHLKGRLRELHNENQLIIGEEIGADGVEISVHENPAPDHEKAQGRQFSNEEYQKLQAGQEATDYRGIKVNLDHDHKNGYRPISEMNCYHYVFSVILGVNEPEYNEKQLKEIIDRNEKGFEYDGKHYTMYQGEQLQRNLEREIRKQKDIHILAKSSGDIDLMSKAHLKITQLTRKYHQLSEVSGLSTKMKRMSVSGYRRSKITTRTVDKYDFNKYKNVVDDYINGKISIKDFVNNYDYKGFINEYDKFYNSIDEKEIKTTYDKYLEYCDNEDEILSQPIGELVNKKLGYDKKPELIDEKDFWIDEDGESVLKYRDATLLDREHWFRGISESNNTKKYIQEFKDGDFFAGTGIHANGTHFTFSQSTALKYANDNEENLIYAIPKDNAKTIDLQSINTIKNNIVKYIPNKNELYKNFTYAVLNDNGYVASLLGYDIIIDDDIEIVLNRNSIKVVK